MHRRLLTAVAISTITALCGFPLLSFAHTTETSGTVQATIHVEPGHAPIAGEQASIGFSIEDTARQLDFAQCECYVMIAPYEHEEYEAHDGFFTKYFTDEGVTVLGNTLSFNYIFPKAGVYMVHLQGKPKAGASFSEFSMSFDVPVGGEGSAEVHDAHSDIKHSIGYATIFGIGIAAGLVITAFDKAKRNKGLE